MAVSLVLGLGLEHSCPWPREGLSSERLYAVYSFLYELAEVLVAIENRVHIINISKTEMNT